MYDTPLRTLPKIGPKHSLYHTSVLGRRVARHSQAGHRLRQAFGETTKPHPFHLKTSPGNITHLPEGQGTHVFGYTDNLYLTVFSDHSAFLGKLETDTLRIFPDVLHLRNQIKHTSPDEKSKRHILIKPRQKHSIFIEGNQDMIAVYEKTLHNTMKFWAETLETLGKINDPRATPNGFWPSFAPVNTIPQTQYAKLNTIMKAIETTLSKLENKQIGITLTGQTLDYNEAHKKPSIRFSTQFEKGKQRIYREWVNSILFHQNFPIQGREWLLETLVTSHDSGYKTLYKTTANYKESGHDYFESHYILQSLFNIDPPSIP